VELVVHLSPAATEESDNSCVSAFVMEFDSKSAGSWAQHLA
jgi:hypothetical protein